MERANITRTAIAAPALNIISTNVPVATSNPEIRWPELNIIHSRDDLARLSATSMPQPLDRGHPRKKVAGRLRGRLAALTTLVQDFRPD
jgi:hypothetical protein